MCYFQPGVAKEPPPESNTRGGEREQLELLHIGTVGENGAVFDWGIPTAAYDLKVVVLTIQVEIFVVRGVRQRLVLEAIAHVSACPHLEMVPEQISQLVLEFRLAGGYPIADMVTVLEEREDNIHVPDIQFVLLRLLLDSLHPSVPPQGAVPLVPPLLGLRHQFIWIQRASAVPFWHSVLLLTNLLRDGAPGACNMKQKRHRAVA